MRYGVAAGSQFDPHLWALVLAAGEGSRLRSLTTTADGIAVPKQYCSLHGGPSLLEHAWCRAETLVHEDRVCTVVASQHERWWREALASRHAASVIVQPKNRGTAIGIMLPLLHILKRDPDARVILLPSDHHVREERVLSQALARAAARLDAAQDKILLLGIEPDEVDSELGYIVPQEKMDTGIFTVESFVEKPALPVARKLLSDGALWNTFIVTATAQTLLTLFAQRYPQVLTEMHDIICGGHDEETSQIALENFYESVPNVDFSRDVLQVAADMLELVAVPPCGWSDLGTPKRVKEVLSKWPYHSRPTLSSSLPSSIPITLAAQLSGSAM